GFGDEVRYVPGLAWNFAPLESGNAQPGLTGDLRFDAPAPEPSPYSIHGTVTTEGAVPVYPVTTDIWRETSLGMAKFEISHPTPGRFGLATQWQVTTDPQSAMGRMIGAGTQKFVCTPEILISPVVSLI